MGRCCGWGRAGGGGVDRAGFDVTRGLMGKWWDLRWVRVKLGW